MEMVNVFEKKIIIAKVQIGFQLQHYEHVIINTNIFEFV